VVLTFKTRENDNSWSADKNRGSAQRSGCKDYALFKFFDNALSYCYFILSDWIICLKTIITLDVQRYKSK